MSALKDAVKEGKRGLELMEEHTEVYAKYPRFIHDYIRAIEGSKTSRVEFIARDGWQRDLKEQLGGEPDSRKIHWYFDCTGNSGKSYFANNYSDKSTYIITGGKNADIYYAYQFEKVVIFDLPRAKEEIVCYDVMEAFKNGYFLSTKYECKPTRFGVPHVVVFANFMPDTSKLSADRWDIKTI